MNNNNLNILTALKKYFRLKENQTIKQFANSKLFAEISKEENQLRHLHQLRRKRKKRRKKQIKTIKRKRIGKIGNNCMTRTQNVIRHTTR